MRHFSTNNKYLELIDKFILFFIVLFLISLTNSIFINQIGYYGALILILGRYFYSKENQFIKTGLELPIVLFIVAEIISTIVSLNQPQSVEYMFKRFLLLPVIYVMIAATGDIKRAKLYFNIFIVTATIGAGIYIVYSYEYLLKGLFQLTGAGPSLFQFQITTSELLSFSSLILLAFIINEKTTRNKKIILILLFLINFLALLATYKRTGWIGFAAGVVIILLLNRRYYILIFLIIVSAVLFLYDEDENKIFTLDTQNGSIEEFTNYAGEGRPYSLKIENDALIVSDFSGGLLRYKDEILKQNLELSLPVTNTKNWQYNFYVSRYIDASFALLNKSHNDSIKYLRDFLTRGDATDYITANGKLYVIDLDSGLTVFNNPTNLNENIYYNKFQGYDGVLADSMHIYLFSRTKGVKVCELSDGLPSDHEQDYSINHDISFQMLIDNLLIFTDEKGLVLLNLHKKELKYLKMDFPHNDIYMGLFKNDRLFIVSFAGLVREINYPISDSIKVINEFKLDFNPVSIELSVDKLFLSKIKTSRIRSIFDLNTRNNFSRIRMWSTGLKIFKDYAIFGVGDIGTEKIYAKYKIPADKDVHGHFHNNYIHLLVTLGLFGFVAVMTLLVKVMVLNIKIFKRAKHEPFAGSFALGAIGCFISFLFAGLTEWNFGDHEIITMIWFITGLNLAIFNTLKIKADEKY